MESRRRGGEAEEVKPVERGWYPGGQEFRRELVEQVGKQSGPSHFGEGVVGCYPGGRSDSSGDTWRADIECAAWEVEWGGGCRIPLKLSKVRTDTCHGFFSKKVRFCRFRAFFAAEPESRQNLRCRAQAGVGGRGVSSRSRELAGPDYSGHCFEVTVGDCGREMGHRVNLAVWVPPLQWANFRVVLPRER